VPNIVSTVMNATRAIKPFRLSAVIAILGVALGGGSGGLKCLGGHVMGFGSWMDVLEYRCRYVCGRI